MNRKTSLVRLTRPLLLMVTLLTLLVLSGAVHAQELLPIPALPGGSSNTRATAAPEEPVPYSPFDGGVSNNLKPSFRWLKATGATKYVIRLTDAGNGTQQKGSLLSNACTSACEYTFGTKLLDGHNYTWQVEASNSTGKTKSDLFTLAIDHPGAPTLLTPLHDNKVLSAAVQLSWTSISDATEYTIKVSDMTGGSTALKKTVSASICGGSCVYTLKSSEQTAIIDGHDYKWMVTAKNSSGSSKSGKYVFKARFE